jgi:hypothetical protein
MNPPSVYQMVVDHFGALSRRFKGGWVHSIVCDNDSKIPGDFILKV